MADPNLTEGKNQLNAALRYAGTGAATLFTVLGAIAIIPPEKVPELITALHQFNESILSAYGALTKMWIIIGPIAGIWLAKVGVQSSSVKSIGEKLMSIAKGAASPAAVEAQKVAIDVTTAVAQDNTIPTHFEAKVALLDAVASQPEVVGAIKVTDPALVTATQSTQIQKAAA